MEEGALDTFVAGMVGGWMVFGERTAVSVEQVRLTLGQSC